MGLLGLRKRKNSNEQLPPTIIDILEKFIIETKAYGTKLQSLDIPLHDLNKEMAELDEVCKALPKLEKLLEEIKDLDKAYDIAASTAETMNLVNAKSSAKKEEKTGKKKASSVPQQQTIINMLEIFIIRIKNHKVAMKAYNFLPHDYNKELAEMDKVIKMLPKLEALLNKIKKMDASYDLLSSAKR